MSTPSRRRLLRDFKRMEKDAPPGVSASPTDDDIMKWHAVIFGPDDTAFEGGTFRCARAHPVFALFCFSEKKKKKKRLSLEFTEEYPNKPPTVKFISNLFHPNGWSPFHFSLLFSLFPPIFLKCTRTVRFVWTFCRTNGVRFTMWQQFSPVFSLCWEILILILRLMQRLRVCL